MERHSSRVVLAELKARAEPNSVGNGGKNAAKVHNAGWRDSGITVYRRRIRGRTQSAKMAGGWGWHSFCAWNGANNFDKKKQYTKFG